MSHTRGSPDFRVLTLPFIDTFHISRAAMRSPLRLSIMLSAIVFVFAASLSALSPAQPSSQVSSAQLPVEWTAPVTSLAEKIASAVGAPRGPLAMNLTNSSSLRPPDASAVYDALLAALRARQFQIVSPAPPSSMVTRVLLTLSEDATRYIWVAQVWTAPGAEAQVAIASAPKLADRSAATPEVSVALSRRLIWSQPGKILDFVLQEAPNQAAGLIVLEPERLAFYYSSGNGWLLARTAPVSHTSPWPRDLTGTLDAVRGKVTIDGQACDGDFLHPDTSLRCDIRQGGAHPMASNNVSDNKIADDKIAPQIDGRSQDVANLGTVCVGLGPLLLTSGVGDWTQTDDLRAYEAAGGPIQAVGQPFELPGPVLALSVASDGKSARVVSRNLQTGMYEASIVAASCGN
jgi:hypothetical protein